MTAIILVARLLSSCAAAWPLRPWGAHRGAQSVPLARLLSSCAAAWPLRPWAAHRGARPIAVASQASFRGKHSGDARVEARGVCESATHRLEGGLGDVVQVLAVMHVDVQGDLRVEGESTEEVLEQIEVEVGDPRAAERHVEHEIRAARDVHRGVQEGLIHGQEGGAVANDPRAIPERLAERLAET